MHPDAADTTMAVLDHLLGEFSPGRANARPASGLAQDLGISERTLRALVDELVAGGFLVGSLCSGPTPGYFLIVDEEDLRVGTAHLLSRARSMWVRVQCLRRAAAERFGERALRLFELEEVSP